MCSSPFFLKADLKLSKSFFEGGGSNEMEEE